MSALEVLHHFDSLAACLDHLRRNYPYRTVRIQAVDVASGERSSADAPAFIFRGEEAVYPATAPSVVRMRSDAKLSPAARDAIERRAIELDVHLRRFLQLDPLLSAGFIQHYGGPTELLDFTTDIVTAGCFAGFACDSRVGLICVASVEAIANRAVLIDLTKHPSALRPRWQRGFALFHRQFQDFKADECVRDLQLSWYSFAKQSASSSVVADLSVAPMLDAHTDPFAGTLQLIMDGLPKMMDEAALWWAQHLPPAPFVLRPDRSEMILVSESELGITFDEARERAANHRKWSLLYSDSATDTSEALWRGSGSAASYQGHR